MSTDNNNVNINMELLKLTHIKYAIGLHVKELQEVCNAIKSIDDFPHNIKDECGEVEVVSEGFITFLNNLTKKITEEIQNSTNTQQESEKTIPYSSNQIANLNFED